METDDVFEDHVPMTKITPLKMMSSSSGGGEAIPPPLSTTMDRTRLTPLAETTREATSRGKKSAPGQAEDGDTSGVIIIGMDTSVDGTITERTASILSESRRSSSLVDHRPSSETNGTDHENDDAHDDHSEQEQTHVKGDDVDNGRTVRNSISSST